MRSVRYRQSIKAAGALGSCVSAVLLIGCVQPLWAAQAESKVSIASGDAYLAKDDFDNAITAYRKALQEDPASAEAHRKLGHAFKLSGDLDRALDELRSSLEIEPKSADAHYEQGWIFGMQHKFKAAAVEEKMAIALDPKNARAYATLGLALSSLGDYPGAIAAFQKAMELDPDDTSIYLNLGATLGRKGDYEEAIKVYEKALSMGRGAFAAHMGLAAAYGKVGDKKGQIAEYRKAVELAPKNSTAHGRLGFALLENGDIQAAVVEGSKANEIRLRESSNSIFSTFLTAWAGIFGLFGIVFAVVFFGSRFKPQSGEEVLKSFFLTFYKDRPGRFVVTTRRLIFVPEAFSQWFGSTRVSLERDQIERYDVHSTMKGGVLTVLSRNGSVHQFMMPNLVLEPLSAQLKEQHISTELEEREIDLSDVVLVSEGRTEVVTEAVIVGNDSNEEDATDESKKTRAKRKRRSAAGERISAEAQVVEDADAAQPDYAEIEMAPAKQAVEDVASGDSEVLSESQAPAVNAEHVTVIESQEEVAKTEEVPSTPVDGVAPASESKGKDKERISKATGSKKKKDGGGKGKAKKKKG
jgi:tetratricopeptide (TPR) repeat protein